jgi:hypothetical protein
MIALIILACVTGYLLIGILVARFDCWFERKYFKSNFSRFEGQMAFWVWPLFVLAGIFVVPHTIWSRYYEKHPFKVSLWDHLDRLIRGKDVKP